MNVSALAFPVLCFSQGLVDVVQTEARLTTCGKGALRNGYFEHLLIVDSSGTGVWVKRAKKLHGVGPFWGYNMFLNQRIQVELFCAEESFHVSVEEVRKRVLASFKQWHGWSTRGDFEELQEQVARAQTISELIHLMEDTRAGTV